MDSTILRFGNSGEFVLKRAVTGEDRLRCWNLDYREYLGMGYAAPNRLAYRYSVFDALPDTATFFVEAAGTAVGTVTLFADSPMGLPADEAFRVELEGKEIDMKAWRNLSLSNSAITHERFGRGLAGAAVMLTATLGIMHSPYWLWVTMGVAFNLTFSALTDRCPVKSALIRMGMIGERELGRAEALGGRPTRI